MSIDEMADEFKELPVGDTSRGIAAAKEVNEELEGKLNKKSIETSPKVQEPTVPEASSIQKAVQEGQRPVMGDVPQYSQNDGQKTKADEENDLEL